MHLKNMFKLSKFIKYSFLLNLGLLITNQSFSPETNVYAERTFSELKKEIAIKNLKEEKRKEILGELNKPVLDFYAPVDTGQISCVYGSRKVNEKNEQHNGIDIGILGNASLKSAERPDILAAASGIVDFAGNENGYGRVVKIKHKNNLETIYAHLNNFYVKKGDTILAQQKIGEMGRTGNARSDKKSSKIHLHFEARKNNKPFNPNQYFKGYKKIGIDDTLYSPISETNFVSYLSAENINNLNVIKQPEKINIKNISESSYAIQIAASLAPLSKNKIKSLEKFYNNIIKECKAETYKNGREEMYYKYSIKQFSSLEEALGFKSSLNSENNLGIIIYKENKIVETKWSGF